ncbi:hypothetical protein D9M68_844220 [compost metagenome]
MVVSLARLSADFLSQLEVVWYHPPRPLCIKHAQFPAVGKERPHAAQVIRVHVDQQLVANQMRACREHTVGIAHAVQINMRTYPLVKIGPHAATPRRLHQAEGSAALIRKPRHQRPPATHEILYCLERRGIVQATVWHTVVACNGVLDELL